MSALDYNDFTRKLFRLNFYEICSAETKTDSASLKRRAEMILSQAPCEVSPNALDDRLTDAISVLQGSLPGQDLCYTG